MCKVSVRRTRVLLLLLLCSVIAWLSYKRLSHHVEVFVQHVGFNLLHEPPERDTQRPRLRDLYRSGFQLASPGLCPNRGQHVDLLILVASTPHHVDHRMAIRQTWGQFHGRRHIVIGFMLGVHSDPEVSHLVAEESAFHADVIINRNPESYSNLTLKTTAMFEWTRSFCPMAARVLKADDDMFINIPRLLGLVRSLAPTGRVIYGRLRVGVRPERFTRSKYFLSEWLYPPHVYPPFTTGGAYLTTPDVTSDLLEAALNMTYLPLEDVFFTGVVAQLVGVTRVAAPEITNTGYYYRRNPCLVHKAITFHVEPVEELYRLWSYLLDKRSWCEA